MAIIKNDTINQIPLFEIQEHVQEEHGKPPVQETTEKMAPQALPTPRSKPTAAKAKWQRSPKPVPLKKPVGQPGPIPVGDVRLTANIRQELHLKLKIVAATRRTTIGELIEELVEQYL